MFSKVITKDDIPYIKYLSLRDNFQYELRINDNDQLEAVFELPEDMAETIRKDIACEKQSAMRYTGIPVYSFETLCDDEKHDRLVALNRTTAYVPLAEDSEKINKFFLLI